MEDDSTDWSGTHAPFVDKFEEKLRCPICRELLRRAPTMTECGHTFCGECIGRHLNSEKTCPLCRVEIQRAKLRLNKIIEDLADDWSLSVRQPLMDRLKVTARAEATAASIPASDQTDTDAVEVIDLSSDPQTQTETQSLSETQNISQTQSLPKDYAICPICVRALPIAEIQGKHIDECLRSRTAAPDSAGPPPKKRAVFGTRSRKDAKKLTLPFYPGMSDTKLKNLLKDAQLSTKGSKQKLIARHQEWVNIWNTNLLSRHPRSTGELRQVMAQWDRSQEHKGNTNLKDLDATQWTQQNKASFDELVQHARKAKTIAKETNGDQENKI